MRVHLLTGLFKAGILTEALPSEDPAEYQKMAYSGPPYGFFPRRRNTSLAHVAGSCVNISDIEDVVMCMLTECTTCVWQP